MSAKPAIVFVPGAWHKVAQYSLVTLRLEQAGYEVHGVDYPSTGPNPTHETFDPDVEKISGVIESLADQGRDVLVAVHSAAGIIAGEAAKGLLKSTRESNGKQGGITHMVYICAFAAAEGTSLWETANGPQDWEIVEGATVRCGRPEMFYNRCTPEQAKENTSNLQRFAKGTLTSRTSYAPWKEVACTYLICQEDHAIPPAAQEAMSTQPGAKFEVVRCQADHSPFLCMPEFTTNVIRQAAREAIELQV
ncbi:uncharacterized protein LTR77_002810 [Saxophila tyrrhenica]|uniref:AB hydrolase-1 domain-containing protein n=1 Tax=Saxophila tyrrhenica TaxID=1690608 RepID=A0AAV9PGH4_9PEZI|nr:hypothetical protein LTR77_002810 [Saxophila tyrrhenica]